MKTKVFVGVGAAFAALASLPASAQDLPTQTINQNLRQEYISNETSNSTQRIINEGIPRQRQQAPSLGLGNIYGLNPCAAGVSVGVTTPLVGLGGAFSTIDAECQTRNNAAVLVSGLRDEAAAREVLCTIQSIREAFIRVGRPCIADGGQIEIVPSNYPAGAGQAGQYQPTNGPTGGSRTPVGGDPSRRSSSGSASTSANAASANTVPANTIAVNAPAFCRVPGLRLEIYPECLERPVAYVPGTGQSNGGRRLASNQR